MHPIREARLKPEFASEYPGLEPGVWYPAATIAEFLLTQQSTLGGPEAARALATEHFEFRGGSPGSTDLRRGG
jgi:hypothetical protein